MLDNKDLLIKVSELKQFEEYLSDKSLRDIVSRMVIAHYRDIKSMKRTIIAEVTERTIKELFDREIKVDGQIIARLEQRV